METDKLLWFNGVDGSTGDYLFPPMPPETLARLALGDQLSEAERQALGDASASRTRADLAPVQGLDPKRLDQCGWGIIFAEKNQSFNGAIKEALQELIDLRRSQARAGGATCSKSSC